jgi:hypothetical protein
MQQRRSVGNMLLTVAHLTTGTSGVRKPERGVIQLPSELTLSSGDLDATHLAGDRSQCII